MTNGYRASATAIDVTPPVGFPLGGYILRAGVSNGVLDPILARLLYLGSGGDAVLVISLDWVYIDGRWAERLKRSISGKTGIRTANIIVAATHTHSGPGVFGSFIKGAEGEPAYLAEVEEKTVGAAGPLVAAAKDVIPVLGSGRITGIGANRNDPGLPVDDRITVLSLRGVDDTDAVSRIIVYGCHPTLLGPENLLFSADWVGRGLAAVDRRMGGGSLFINGAGGDVSTRFTRKGRGAEDLERFAALFSEAVSGAEFGAAALPGTGIGVTAAGVPVRYRDLPDRDAAGRELAEAEAAIVRATGAGAGPGEIRRLESAREAAIVSTFFANRGGLDAVFGKRAMTATVTLVRIGSMGLVFFPGEVMSGSAAGLKAETANPLAVCGYANDYFGYFAQGGGGYESSMTLLAPDSIEAVFSAARRLIAEGM